MKSSTWLLIVAVVVGLTVRGWHINNIGYGLHPDEVINSYEGLSIATTGCDVRHTGCPPLYLKGYSTQWDNRTSVLYPYLFSLLLRVVPMNTFWVRLPSLLAGVGVIFLVFLVGRQIFPKRPTAAGWAAILVALSPIGISWSRVGHDPILVPFFSALIVYSLLRSRASPRWLLLTMCTLAIGLYGYQTFKVVGLGVTVATWLMFRPTWNRQYKQWFLTSLIVSACLVLPFLVNQLSNWTIVQRQFTLIAIWNWPSPILQTVLEFGQVLFHWFLNPFLSCLVVFPFFIFALVQYKRGSLRTLCWLLLWIVIGIVPALVTIWHTGSNEMQSRALGLLGPVELLAGFGIAVFIERASGLFGSTRWARGIIYSGIAAVLTGAGILSGVCNQATPAWSSLTITGVDQPLAWLQQKKYSDRPVVMNLYSFTQPYALAWRERIPPVELQQTSAKWQEMVWKSNSVAQYPSIVGRFTFCKTSDCWKAHDGRLYVLPAEEQSQLLPLYTFQIHIGTYTDTWKIIDNQ